MAPIVPTYTQPDVQPQGIPNVQFNPGANAEDFGAGQSTQEAFNAIGRVGEAGQQIALNEKQKADNLQFTSADGQASALQTQIQVGAGKMLGKDALGAPDYAQKNWQDGIQKIRDGLQNDAQRFAFDRAAATRWQELNRSIQFHLADQVKAWNNNETQGYLDQSKNAAVLNAFDDQKVSMELARQKAVLSEWGKNQGILGSAQFQSKLTDLTSSTQREVIQARLDADQPNSVQAAKSYFSAHKDEMNAQDVLHIQKQIDGAETTAMGLDAWNKVQGMKLSDGTPDEAKMQATVMSDPNLSLQKKEQVWQFVKARAREQIVDNAREESANDRDFMNAVIQARKEGQPMDQAMKLVSRFAKDDYDQALKTQAVQRTYAPPSQSDPSAFMNLWEGVQNGGSSKQAIDQAFQKNQINEGDWRSLREQYFKQQTQGTDADEKGTWGRVKILAENQFGSDKKQRDAFLYEMHQTFDGKPSEEIWKGANDKLKSDPNKGWFIFGKQPQWQSDLQRDDAQNMAWGKAYQDIGKDQATAIGQGALMKGAKSWGLGDLDAFAQSFGGYDAIKVGTPVNTAIESLRRRGQLVTPANVKAVLAKHPDGNY